MKFLILGSGFQGRACAYDMLRNPAVTEVALCDMSAANLDSAKKFLAKVSNGRAKFKRLDAGDPAAVKKALKGYSALVSCVPYFLNLPLAKAAIAARVHYATRQARSRRPTTGQNSSSSIIGTAPCSDGIAATALA